MCGIVGFIGLDNHEPISENVFVQMNDIMKHRGPDGDGFYFSGSWDEKFINQLKKQRPTSLINHQSEGRIIGLGHRRLSIIDLDPLAGQPMSDNEKKIWIVFNGEIYNHKHIRKELVYKGYQFKTDHSDTEVIIYAYKEWGQDFVHKLRGMFAIALWDSKKDRMFLYRDRTGIKPLYYTIANGRLYFASEIKAILQDKTIKRAMNEEGLYHYLSFLVVPAPETLFKNIYKLSAGHYIEIRNGKVSSQKEYWDVFDNVSMLYDKSEEEIKNGLLESLKDSVSSHLEADVPVGVFLSGGIDSSTNAALFNDIATHRVKAFSIGYKDDDKLKSYTNEFIYSRQVAKEFGLDYHELELTQEDLIDFIPKLIHHQDEPIADPVCLPIYFVSKLAKDHGVTVAQVGEGSDELFWGYDSWKSFLKLQNLNDLPVPNLLKKLGLQALELAGKGHSGYYEFLRRAINREMIFWSGSESFFATEKKSLLSKRLNDKYQNYSSWHTIEPHYKKFLASAPEKSHLNWMSYINLKLRLSELLLMRVDKMSMAVSLEARVPFLDERFVSYAMSISSKLKTKKNESKYILKKTVAGVIPHNVIYRKKQGFGAPVYDWYLGKLGKISNDSIHHFNKETEVFNPKYIKKLQDNHEGGKVWHLYNLAAWWENYINQ